MRLNRLAIVPAIGLLAGIGGAVATARTTAAAGSVPLQRPAAAVTLLTGDRVIVGRSMTSRPMVTVVPVSKGASFQDLALGGQAYVIPKAVSRLLGRPLDLSLFNVTRLAAAGYGAAGRPVPLAITYAPHAHRQALPGIRMVAPGRGVLTRAGSLQFGRALAAYARSLADGTARRGAFAGITRISLAGATPANGMIAGKTGSAIVGTGSARTSSGSKISMSAAGQLYTVTVKGFDRHGFPDTGSIVDLLNVDSSDNYLAAQTFFRGVAKFSVPAGNYLIASYISTGSANGTDSYSLVADPEVPIKDDTVVVLDARKADPVTATTPDPTTTVQAELSLQRNAAAGDPFTMALETFRGTSLYATPTAPATEGNLNFSSYFRLGDANAGTGAYIYDMEFPSTGVIPGDLAYTVTRDQLATIDARYHSPYPGRAEYEAREAILPGQAFFSFGASPLAAPLARTEYVLPQPGMLWLHDLYTDTGSQLGDTQDIVRAYQPGEHVTEDWLAQPMPPGVPQELTAGEPCPACRTGDTLMLSLVPYLDNAGHFQLPEPASTTTDLSLYQDGTLIADQPGTLGQFPMSPSPANYRLVLSTSRNEPWWPTTTSTSTTWTWSSQERPADQLPAGWTCGGKGGGGGGGGKGAATTGCSFEPLLFIGYHTNAGLDDVVPAGRQATVSLTIGHQYGEAPATITAVTAQVSFDDGKTWSPVTPTQTGDGRYRLVYDQPSLEQTSGFATLHVTATDSSGSAIDQTITRAYPLSVLTPPPSPTLPPLPAGQQRACGGSAALPFAQCMAIINTKASALTAAGTPGGYGPSDIQSAYNLPDGGSGQTVAIVDAYDDPNAEADLAAYRAQYGLPPCTTSNGCFTKVNQDGNAVPLPSPDDGWGVEISLDLDAVSATCPKCHIMLVEASDSNPYNLGTSVDTAVRLGATVVSNSYGSVGEFSGEQYFQRFYDHRGVPIVASSGDFGYGNGAITVGGVGFPAASSYVIAVGGTSLVRDPSAARGWNESAWDGSTSGCSAYIHKPGWQKDPLCGNRTVADVSAVADPRTGLAIYDTFDFPGWLVVGGTSAASPIIAGVYALAGNGSTQRYASNLYADPSHLFDVTSGASGGNCSGTYLCTAVPGYDGPTGLGTPNGVGSF